MTLNKHHFSFKALTIILFLLVFGGVVYIYDLTLKNTKLYSQSVTDQNEKQVILKNLQELQKNYDAVLVSESGLKTDLELEKSKVAQLITDLQTNKSSETSLVEWRKKYFNLASKFHNLLLAYNALKSENEQLIAASQSSVNFIKSTSKTVDTLKNENKELSKKINKASQLNLVNLQTFALNENENGIISVVNAANKVSMLNISFSIPENNLIEKGKKNYFIQVIDAKNNVLGEKKIKKFGTKELVYSFLKNINYNNKTVEINENLSVSNLTSGTYTINVYDDGRYLAKTFLELQ